MSCDSDVMPNLLRISVPFLSKQLYSLRSFVLLSLKRPNLVWVTAWNRRNSSNTQSYASVYTYSNAQSIFPNHQIILAQDLFDAFQIQRGLGGGAASQLSYQSLDHYHQGGVPTGVID